MTLSLPTGAANVLNDSFRTLEVLNESFRTLAGWVLPGCLLCRGFRGAGVKTLPGARCDGTGAGVASR